MLKALVFGANSQSVRYMCQMCAEIPDLVVIRSLETLPKAHDLTRILNSFAPQLVFLEACPGDLSQELAQQMLDFRAEIPLITFSLQPPGRGEWNPASMGLHNLNIPFSGETFQDVLFRGLSRGSSAGTQARLIAFLPAKGGSGATTISLGVATMIARQLQKRVLFLECDVNSGPAAAYLALRPARSIIDVLEDAQLLDFHPFSQLVTRYQDLDVLLSVGRRPMHRLSAWSCQRMLSRARSTYDFVFCDLPDSVDETFEPVLRAADQVILVTTPSEATRFLAERRINMLSQLGIADTRISLIENRAWLNEPGVTKIRQIHVSARIPNRPLLLDSSRFDIAQIMGTEIERPLTAVAEMCAGQPLASAKPRRNFSLGSLWSSLVQGPARSGNAGAKG